ncbi:Phospholipase_D-nuclease N-terminal [Nocardioides sp. YR527]|uniref:SHOCT domain-containing protein n=1 Tax=Nocardioides sp. YR527 TaxID=1881028 RepID=UPI00087F0128|nr:SHOCT domain-containing protein [Nocardioides sp. YR527]SDK56121.1 Phospholipase_D-nuclease N-terminal [Nocardioides sp. YR527]
MSFWDIIWFIIVSFAFVAYLMILFNIVTDLFRDKSVSGWIKAVWMIGLVFLPFLIAVIYLIVRGKGMAERQGQAYQDVRAAQDDYIRSVAGSSPAEEIAKAQQLLDAGTITPEEFAALKAKAMAT